MGGNTMLAAGTSAIYADEEEFKEVVEDEEEPIKEVTFIFHFLLYFIVILCRIHNSFIRQNRRQVHRNSF